MTDNGPTFCDVLDPQARERHQPISCPDKTLTALCQLGALRLNARRCLLFFFDLKNAYVLAEATRSLSLEDDCSHDEGDQLWLGHAMIPRGIACCEMTVNLPTLASSLSVTSTTDQEPIFVVNDLTENSLTQDQPYVTAFPYGRFYAGVPIKSPAGINIGAYCILDDDSRDGISERDATFMLDMSRTIMTHLETIRAQSDRQRGTNMVTGLGRFVQASSDPKRYERRRAKRKLRTGSNTTSGESDLSVRTRRRAIKCGVPDALAEPEDSPKDFAIAPNSPPEYFDMKTVEAQNFGGKLPVNRGQSRTNATAVTPATDSAELLSPTNTINPESQATPGSQSAMLDGLGFMQSPDQRDSSSSPLDCKSSESDHVLLTPRASSVAHTEEARPSFTKHESKTNLSAYQRAAEVMCDSLSMDGVAFLDASVGTFGGLSEDAETVDGTDALRTCSDSEWDAAIPGLDSPSITQKMPSPCTVLGCAMSVRDGENVKSEIQPSKKMTETFLRTILRRYPCGKIWTFDRSGTAFDNESSSDEDHDEAVTRDPIAQQRKSRCRERRRDGEILQAMFPGARTIAIHGIRDEHGRRFTAGCLLWNFDALRVLTKTSEMSFVAAFCNVVVAEDKRHKVQRSDQAKSDFLSSISHELRTPLCGILGSTEVLKDHQLDNMATALVEQIDVCGRTLLDIIDSLLEFTNLKGRQLAQGSVSSTNIGIMLAGRRNSTQGDVADADLSIALDDLTEEVTESTVFSYFCSKSAEERSRISVVTDVDRSPDTDWSCTLASGGWRRICMNLVNNALKYTDSGYVRIKMHQKQISRRHFEAILTITDSGKGMSRAFVNDELFREFTQEDTNVDGVGLGMNVVGQLVNAMGGSIQVNSDQHGAGTCVVVNVPLERSRHPKSWSMPDGPTLGDLTRGMNIGIVLNGQERLVFTTDRKKQLEITADTLAINSIQKTCEHLGLDARIGGWADCSATKLNFMLEEDFTKQVDMMQNDFDANGKCVISSIPSVVICKNSPSAQTTQEAWRNHPHHSGIITEYIASPCGLRTISRAISSALQRHKFFQDSEVARVHDNMDNKRRELAAGARTRSLDDASVLHTGEKSVSSTTLLKPSSPVDTRGYEVRTPRSSGPEQKQDVHLPYRQISSSEKQREPHISAQDTLNNDVPVLLLVDDNNINLQLLRTYAKKRKYPYLSAVDGQLALDAYIQAHKNFNSNATPAAENLDRPSIVLMDINMPNMDGYESTQRIRAYEKKHHLTPSKIIALTALSSGAAHKEAFGSGFDMFMTKPIKFKDLTEIIEGVRQSRPASQREGAT
jgi:signal transduction histidine kinase/AmiR/NasT family two-component response regulator